jgi:hypothetical protein
LYSKISVFFQLNTFSVETGIEFISNLYDLIELSSLSYFDVAIILNSNLLQDLGVYNPFLSFTHFENLTGISLSTTTLFHLILTLFFKIGSFFTNSLILSVVILLSTISSAIHLLDCS